MLASILFMFGALVELAIISYVARQREKILESRKDSSNSPGGSLKGTHKNRKRSTENGFEWQMLAERERERINQGTRENGVLSTPSNASVRSFDDNGTIRSKRSMTTWWPMQIVGERRGKKRRRVPISPDAVDKVFLCLYPPTFLAFNIFYWWYYLPHAIW